MKKLLLIPVFMFLIVACEDEKDDASSSANCSTIMAELDAANAAFETSMSKADCEKVIEKAEALVNCMPDGAEKNEMKSDLDDIRGVCQML